MGSCSYAPVGYYIGSGQSVGSMTMRGIPVGYYKTSVSSSTATICGQNEQCTTTATTGCDAMKYSESGQSYCTRVRIGYYITGGHYSACTGTSTDYNKVTSACVTCSYKKCDQYTAIGQYCPVGYYFSSSTSGSCSICGTGYYC